MKVTVKFFFGNRMDVNCKVFFCRAECLEGLDSNCLECRDEILLMGNCLDEDDESNGFFENLENDGCSFCVGR